MKTMLLGGVLAAVLFVAPASAATYNFESSSGEIFGYGPVAISGSVTFDTIKPGGSATDPVTVSISLTDKDGTQTFSTTDASFVVGTDDGGQEALFNIQTDPTPSQQLDLVLHFRKPDGSLFTGSELDILNDVTAQNFAVALLEIQGNVPDFFPKADDGLFHGASELFDLQWTEAPPVATTPLPPALPLFGAGLALLALLTMRRRGHGLEPVAA